MKYIALGLALVCSPTATIAFTIQPQNAGARLATRRFAEYTPMEGEGKINLKVDLDSPKVATNDEISKGKKVYCRCWLSGTFPMCDGTHVKHNDATGDNVGPLIVAYGKGE